MKPVLGNKEHLRANGRGAEPAPAHLVIRVTSGAISSVPLVPPGGTVAGLIVPYVNAEAMGLHLNEIVKAVAHGAKCLQVPDNITLVKLPPYSPELNPMENVWAYLRSNKLAISIFDTYEEILEKCAQAWNSFANDPERITSITKRDWIKVNY